MTVERAKNVLLKYSLCRYHLGESLCMGKDCDTCEFNYTYAEFKEAAEITLRRKRKLEEARKHEKNVEN